MASAEVEVTAAPPRAAERVEAPITLDEPAAKALGFLDQLGLWGNLGVSLLGFTGALVVLQPDPVTGVPTMSLLAALLATVVGTVLGSIAVGVSAVPGAKTGAPAMVLLRGLFGARLSYLPTGLNIFQLVGWGTFEIVTIATAAHQVAPDVPVWAFDVMAGVITTALAMRPLGAVRVLRKYVTAAVVIVLFYLFVQLLRNPLPSVHDASWRGFWPAADSALAVAISWVPVASDYSRHSKSAKTAFGATAVGYAVTQIACYALGILAILGVAAARDGAATHVFGAFIAVPLGSVAFAILAVREIDQSFCNVYSTAVSVQNLRPRWDRRVLALGVGGIATVLALLIDIGGYASFLAIIGSVFVPLFGVLVVDYFAFGGSQRWNLSESAPTRWVMVAPWAAGFVVYQLVYPGDVSWWATMWADVARWLRFTPESWMSASLLSFAAAAIVTFAVRPLARRPRTADGVTDLTVA